MRTGLTLVLVWSAVSAAAREDESCLPGVCRLLADLADQVEVVGAEVERRTSQIGRLADLEERLAMHEAHCEGLTRDTGHMEGSLKEAHQEIRQLKERLDSQEALYRDLLKVVEETKKNEILPLPQPFVSNMEDNMLGDSNSDDGLSLLLAKMEKVENITSEVQEELKSEKRVRRHLEEDLNATRHDVRMLNDKLAAHDIVEELVNRTLFEERRDETRESDEDKVRRFEEELEYLRAILAILKENSTDAMTLGTARVNDLEARVAKIANASEWMGTTMRKDVQNLQAQLDALAQVQLDERLTRSEIRNLTSEVLAPLDQRVALISEDLANAEHRVDALETSTKHKLKDIDSKLRNATHFWNATLSAMAEHATIRGERMKEAVEDTSLHEECGLPPPSPDPHLLIFPDGAGRLGFACRPPGAFALSSPAHVTCVRSEWEGRLPECRPLPTEEDIQALELAPSDPCANSFGPVPDPSDCASYFECGEGSAAKRCAEGLLFDPGSRSCEPAHSVRCQTALSELVPAIVVEGVDEAYSGLGTGTRGELVVHPRTSLVLHCLYPDDPPPAWRVKKIQEQEDGEEGVFKNVSSAPSGPNRHSIRIPGASSRDSGLYECVTPHGRANRITLVVKSVVCPPLPPPAFHRPHPEGEARVLSTLAEVRCRDGRPAAALCTAAGTWDADCREEDAYPWGCPLLSAGPSGLLLEPQPERVVLFRCGPGSWLVGAAFTRCQEDGRWTHAQPPECHHTAL